MGNVKSNENTYNINYDTFIELIKHKFMYKKLESLFNEGKLKFELTGIRENNSLFNIAGFHIGKNTFKNCVENFYFNITSSCLVNRGPVYNFFSMSIDYIHKNGYLKNYCKSIYGRGTFIFLENKWKLNVNEFEDIEIGTNSVFYFHYIYKENINHIIYETPYLVFLIYLSKGMIHELKRNRYYDRNILKIIQCFLYKK